MSVGESERRGATKRFVPRLRTKNYPLIEVPAIRGAIAAARPLLTEHARWTLRMEFENLCDNGPAHFLRWNASLAGAYARDRLARRHYALLDESGLRESRRSDTVFVFGSGASLNDIAPREWNAIAEHETLGFNHFWRQTWVRVDYHVIRGGLYGETNMRPQAEKVAYGIRANPRYANSIFLMQEDFLGAFPNYVVGHRLLAPGSRLFRYRTRGGPGLPTRSFAEGVRHAPGTLSDAVNCASLIGWKEIVLAGVDLYDSRYFFLPPDQTITQDPATGTVVAGTKNAYRGQRYDEIHNTARAGVVEQMAAWGEALASEGVRLSVYNPRSLLADVLPVFEWPQETRAADQP